MTSRSRSDRIEFRTTPETKQLVERAVAVTGGTFTDFAEASLLTAAQRTLADQQVFDLSPEAADAWNRINDRPARDLPGLRALLDRPSPFGD